MPTTVISSFKAWLKASTNIKLSSDSAVTRITYEGTTTFQSLKDFDKKVIQSLTSICKERISAITADAATGIANEIEIPDANISLISVQQLIVAANTAKYYTSIVQIMSTANIHYGNTLASFKIEWEAYVALKAEGAPKVPAIRDQDNDCKVIKWVPIFQDCLARTYGSRGPLIYVLRDEKEVPTEANDPPRSR